MIMIMYQVRTYLDCRTWYTIFRCVTLGRFAAGAAGTLEESFTAGVVQVCVLLYPFIKSTPL